MKFLVYSPPYYEFCTSTVCEGLKSLGHMVYGYDGSSQNYLEPYDGSVVDFFIDAFPMKGRSVDWSWTPRIMLWPYDKTGPETLNYNDHKYDIMFIRDYEGGGGSNVFPINYGIEDRYFDQINREDKPLKDRKYDVVFIGDNVGRRKEMLTKLKGKLNDFNCLLGLKTDLGVGEEPNEYWSQWVNGRFCHWDDYFRTIADSKILLSFSGSGPDCGRHYESIASHALVFFEKSNTIKVSPSIDARFPHLLFDEVGELANSIREYLSRINLAQHDADLLFSFGKRHLTTRNRAEYMIEKMKEVGIL
jgi:hypothetical protein